MQKNRPAGGDFLTMLFCRRFRGYVPERPAWQQLSVKQDLHILIRCGYACDPELLHQDVHYIR